VERVAEVRVRRMGERDKERKKEKTNEYIKVKK
jgi:hypothetical protein